MITAEVPSPAARAEAPHDAPRPAKTARRHRRRRRIVPPALSAVIGILVVAGAVFWLPIGQGDLQHDASFYAWMGKRIFATGEWLTLYWDWDGRLIYANKPPGTFWLSAVVYHMFGVSIAAARVAPALLFTAAALMLYRVVRQQYSRPVALTAAVVFCLQGPVVNNIGEVRVDGGLVLVSLVASYAVLRLLEIPRDRARSVDALKWCALIGAAVGAGLLLRGLNALLTLPVLLAVVLWQRRADVLRPRNLLVLCLAMLATGGWWYGYQLHAHGRPFFALMYGDASRQAAFGEYAHKHGVISFLTRYALYVPRSLGVWFPAVALGVARMIRIRRRFGRRAAAATPPFRWLAGPVDRMAVAWIGVYLLMLQFGAARTVRYALPVFPWLALLAAIGLFAVRPLRRAWSRSILPRVAPLAIAAAVACALAGVRVHSSLNPELAPLWPVVQAQAEHQRGAMHAPHDNSWRPRVYVIDDSGPPNLQHQCFSQFYSDARSAGLGDGLREARGGDFLMAVVRNGDDTSGSPAPTDAMIRARFPHAELLTSGKRWRTYRLP
jgi:4-amino-4-deoxy-L-arabinose transferase-like glycosyltransferase